MKIVIFSYSAILFSLALIGYTASGATSAFIPAFFAIIVFLLGLFSLRPLWNAKAMHAALIFTTLVMLGTAGSLKNLAQLVNGEEIARPLAVVLQSSTFFASLFFVVSGVVSFTLTRMRRNETINTTTE